jgi:hypothetical protein
LFLSFFSSFFLCATSFPTLQHILASTVIVTVTVINFNPPHPSFLTVSDHLRSLAWSERRVSLGAKRRQ